MKPFFSGFLFAVLLLLSGCKSQLSSFKELPQDKDIQVYFNHRKTSNRQYVDNYRKVKRTGDNLEEVIINGIKQAESTIDLAVHELQLPGVALALAEQAKKGVLVRIIIENNYNHTINDFDDATVDDLPPRERNRYQQSFQLIDIDRDGVLSKQEIDTRDALIILRNAKIPLIDDTADGSQGSGLMHHKFMVIDRKIVITGSSNFTLSDIHGDFNNLETRGNANHLLEINNRELAELFTEEFNYMWSDRLFGTAKPFRSSQSITWDNTQIKVQFSPLSSKQDWSLTGNGLIGQTLEKASNSIDLALFVFSDQNLVDILQEKQQQGVKIRALIDREFIFRYYSEALDMLGVAMYDRCQYEDDNNPWSQEITTVGTANLTTGDKLHHKVAVIDNKIVVTGSQNWSAAANYNNDETVLIIENKTVAKHFQQEFENLYRDSSLGVTEKVEAKIQEQERKCH
jgi:phosphatidylserine/phosphatidylglycerophosphate/cardiolipin synthase-like enzyme